MPPGPLAHRDKCNDKAPEPGQALAGGKQDAVSPRSGGGPAPRKPGALARPSAQPRSEPGRWHPTPATLPRLQRTGERIGVRLGVPPSSFLPPRRRTPLRAGARAAGNGGCLVVYARGEVPPLGTRRTRSCPSDPGATVTVNTYTHTTILF